MSDEFALCWNNFTDNITTGFQSLLFRGDLCDVTLAVDGKLLKAHKVVLSICSPYFQEMFISMPQNQHPILILKDMSATLVSNLLSFMYQGSVTVKQDELQAFMKIAETLQIKGLTTTTDTEEPTNTLSDILNETIGAKRLHKSEDAVEVHKRKERKTAIDLTSDDDCDVKLEEQFQIVQTPENSMESRFEETNNQTPVSPYLTSFNMKISDSHSLRDMDSFEFSNDSSLLVEIPPKSTNHQNVETPNESSSSSTITMLSSTSLLHGSCIFNRNNTVATQAGLKTYWLCKGYRISMCKARCITHQGKVISASGVHNHLPHMNDKRPEVPPVQSSSKYPSVSNDFSTLGQLTSSASYIGPNRSSQQSFFSTSMYQTMPDHRNAENNSQM